MSASTTTSPKNAVVGFRDPDNSSSPSVAMAAKVQIKTTTPAHRDTVEDVFLKPMSKPWTSPSNGVGSQLISSTPHHFQCWNNNHAGLTMMHQTPSTTTTRQSLDLFQRNAIRYALEPPSRPSLTTDFALSALKNSFSMSSLSQQCHLDRATTVPNNDNLNSSHQLLRHHQQPQTTPDENARLKWERPFYSLTRLKERGGGRYQWRRSFGSSPLTTGKDDATNQSAGSSGLQPNGTEADWPALQANYTYLMSCDLIESCRSLNGEMSWDNGDLEHLRQASALQETKARTAQSPSIAVGCQTDAEISIPDLQLRLQLLREWLKRMDAKVPKLILRPKWKRQTLERRIMEFKVLQREIEGHASEFGSVIQRCTLISPRQGRSLETRYHRLLLRILEWTYHLEALAKKPQEFWNGRRAASSPEREVRLPCKQPRLETSSKEDDISGLLLQDHINQLHGQADGEDKMRQNGQGGVSPPLPAPAVPVNMGVYEFKHPDSDTERPADHNSEEERKPDQSDTSENEWVYSPNKTGRSTDNGDGSILSVRKKLSFETEEEDVGSSGKEWYQYSSSDSDWLSGGIDLEDVSDGGAQGVEQPDFATAELPEESANKEAVRVYDKEKVHKLMTEAEQMVSAASSSAGDACRSGKQRSHRRSSNQQLRYGPIHPEGAGGHNSECDASSELTSEGETDDRQEAELDGGGRRSASLNRTFLVPPSESSLVQPDFSPVVMRTRQRIKPQRPWSLSGLGSAGTRPRHWAGSASETALNHLMPSPTLSPCSAVPRPLMCHASTQKDSTDGCFSTSLSSPGAVRQRRRRHSTRNRNGKTITRRNDQLLDLAGQHLSSNDLRVSSNATLLQARLSSASCSSGEYSGGSSGQRRRVVKSCTMTRLSVESNGGNNGSSAPVVSNGPLASTISHSSPIKTSTGAATNGAGTSVAPSTNTSSPRSTAPSDGEHCLGQTDEAGNLSEHWDNYLDRYPSDAYSEDPPDAESARRLLEFGEDYRNDLDSLSDCPSSLSAEMRAHRPHHQHFPYHKRSPPKRVKGPSSERSALSELRSLSKLDSDSDVDDLVHVVKTSSNQYTIALNTFYKAIQHSARPDASSQFAELLATCRTNVSCLQAILTELNREESDLEDHIPSHDELKPVRDLIMKWEELDSKVSPVLHEGQQQKQLQQKVQLVKEKLLELERNVQDVGLEGDLQLNLNKIHHLRFLVEAEKGSLLQVNVDVHDEIGMTKAAQTLKADVDGLYETWELLLKSVMEKQTKLEEAELAWKEIQKQLKDLKAEIALDQEKIQSFIQHQQLTPDDSPSDPSQSSNWMTTWSGTVGSVQCDSGISSGSDGEFITLGEREKRLSTLKQLARKLELALAPGNIALARVNETLDQTQKELDHLQSRLSMLPPIRRSTPVPDAASVKESSVQTDPQVIQPTGSRKNRKKDSPTAPSSSSRLPYFWRVARASLPFHLAFLVMFLAACMYEPSCCNYINTFGSSLLPKLSYFEPPPT